MLDFFWQTVICGLIWFFRGLVLTSFTAYVVEPLFYGSILQWPGNLSSRCPCQFLGVSFYTCTVWYSAGSSRTPLHIFQELLFPTTYSQGGWDSNIIRFFSSCLLTCSIVTVTYFTSRFRLLNFKGWKENWSPSKNLRY